MFSGQIWAGHNIAKFDNLRLKNAFEKIGKAPPEPLEIIDTLALLQKSFGKRAGDYKVQYNFFKS